VEQNEFEVAAGPLVGVVDVQSIELTWVELM
jgi:hypothetical protein